MTASSKHSHKSPKPSEPASTPAEPPRSPPINWSYPFVPISGNAMDSQTYLSALGRSQTGYYPLGANGLWHGGIHFDAATGGALKQGDGVRAIADGEVIAYRLDSQYPELKYSDRRMSLYSTGFVLLRHKLVLPAESKPLKASAKSGESAAASEAGPASAPKASPQPPQTPADQDILEFYSLYMHQLDWAGYQSVEQETPASPSRTTTSLQRMPYWKGDRRFIVGSKANASQQQPASSNVAYRFDQTKDEEQTIRELAGAVPTDGVGNVLASEPIADRAAARQTAPRVRLSAPPVDPSDVDMQAPVQGARVRDKANGDVIGLLPRGSEFLVAGNETAGWAQIVRITKGLPVAAKTGGTLDPRAATGWVRLNEMDVLIAPNPMDSVVVLDKPFAVKAGDVIGYLGEYQNYSDAQILPPKARRPVLHVEVFAGESLEPFIRRSRERAKSLPAGQRSLLVVREGAELVAPLDSDGSIAAGLLLKLAKGDPGKGKWAKVQPMRETKTTDKNGKHKTTSAPAGQDVWVERESSGKIADMPVKSWSKFPLQLSNTRSPRAVFQQVLARAALEQLPNAAQDDANVHWWNVCVGDGAGHSAWGWLCETGHPDTEWQSPWAWPGFELVDSSSITPVNMFKRFLFVTGQLLDGEAEEFSAAAASINAGPLIGRLEKAVDCQGDGDGRITANELRKALGQRWLAGALSHVVVRYESEWGGSMSKWDALSSHMGNGRYIWQGELERIQKLQWWDKVKSVKGFPEEPIVWHLHPVGVVGNFVDLRGGECPMVTIKGQRIALTFLLKNDGVKLSDSDYAAAAEELGCEIRAIKAVAKTETGSSGAFFQSGNELAIGDDSVPAILFERHLFHRETAGKYDESNPSISNRKPGGYGPKSLQYQKLYEACQLDPIAALRSASWGRFQILGSNFKMAGFRAVQDYVSALCLSEANQLRAFVAYIRSDRVLLSAIVEKDWHRFAVRYNGPAQVGYDLRIEKNYRDSL